MTAELGRTSAGAEERQTSTAAEGSRRMRAVRWVVGGLLAAKLAALALSVLGGDGLVRRAVAADDGSPAPSLAVVKPKGERAPTRAEDGSGADGLTTSGTSGARSERARSAADVAAMLEELTRRQAELERREQAVAAREQRLALYEKDVAEKIAQLEQVGKSLKEDLKKSAAASDEAAASLAKVYGAMKPAEAAPLLDQLDEATALRILTRMKEKQVGEILPLMTRERAIVLTRSLAGRATASAPASPKS